MLPREQVHRPADAYRMLQSILAPHFFTIPGPDEGQRMTVIGKDRVETVWEFTTPMARHVLAALSKRPEVKVTRIEPFQRNKAA